MISIHFTAFGGDASVEVPLPACFVPNDHIEIAEAIFRDLNLQQGPFWDRVKDILPADRTHTSLSVGDSIRIDSRVYTCERVGWSRHDDDDDVVSRVDAAMHDGRTAFTAYAIWGDESYCKVIASTNDDLDYGFPSEYAEWVLHFHNCAQGNAIDLARRHTGATRMTFGGVVSVYLNGEPVVGSHA